MRLPYQRALEVYTRENFPIQWAMTQNNLGTVYSIRTRGNRAENFEQAIAACYCALEIYTRESFPIDWAIAQNNLATAYGDRIQGDRAENIEQAIAACHYALEVRTREDFPADWAMAQNNLGIAYSNRIRGDRAENLELAIAAYQRALEVRTYESFPIDWAATQNNLAAAYGNRIRGEQAKNLELAISAYQQSLEIYRPELFPDECRRAARLLGNLYFDQHRWAEVAQSYQLAIQAAENLYQASLFLGSKEVELAATNDLYRRTAYALARSGDLQTAVLMVEQGRARGLSETLERDRADLEQLQNAAPEAYTRYQQVVNQLQQLEAQERALSSRPEARNQITPEYLRNQALQLRNELATVISSIRQIPGYESFLDQPNCTDVISAVQPGTSLIYLVATSAGGLALVVTKTAATVSIDPIWLNDLSETALLELLTGNSNNPSSGGWFGAYNQQQVDRQGWLDVLDQGTAQLWTNLMSPIVHHLETIGIEQAVLIPTGFLGLLPLHAAWTEDASTPTGRRYAFDTISLTYAPNAQSLRAVQAIADRTPASSLLAIDQPSHTGADPLPNSTREVETATDTFPQHQIFRHDQATTQAILAALPQHNVLHFSCHGYAVLDEPLNSGLVMAGDDLLTLRELLNLKLSGVRLAILSACETGLPGTQLPDEVVSLPTGLLQAGVAGVVASLWSVSDLSTMMLLVRFYDLWQTEGLESSQALRRAQQWVRDTTNAQKYDYLKAHFQNLADAQQISAQEVNDLLREFMLHYIYPDGPQSQSFVHPFHWAAFTYVGV